MTEQTGCLHLGDWVSEVVTAENQLPDTYCGDCGAVVIAKTGAEKYFRKLMADPEYAEAYREAKALMLPHEGVTEYDAGDFTWSEVTLRHVDEIRWYDQPDRWYDQPD